MPEGGQGPEFQQSSVKDWFSSLSPLERIEVTMQIEERQRKYAEAIMPPKLTGSQLRVTSADEAQRALLLEAYYSVLDAVFKGEHVWLNRAAGTPAGTRDQIQALRARAEENYALLRPVIERGDWTALKTKWQRQAMEPPKPQRTGDRVADLLARANHKYDVDDYKLREKLFDLKTTQRVLGMVPNQTQPVRPELLDRDPPLVPLT